MNHFDKLYRIARSIAGELGEDLVHHTYLKLKEKNAYKNDSYFVQVMKNEAYNSDSTFNKLYRPDYSTIDFEVIELHEDESLKYDANLLHKIFLELEIEGYEYEVSIYKEAVLVSSINKVSKRLKKSKPRTISPICKQIHEEIKKRYEILNT